MYFSIDLWEPKLTTGFYCSKIKHPVAKMIIEDWPTIKIYKFTVLLSCLVNIVIQALFILTNLDVTYVVVLSSLFIVFYLITFFAAYYEHLLGVLLGGTGNLFK